jgi:two-component system CheB/CheR fusion protein
MSDNNAPETPPTPQSAATPPDEHPIGPPFPIVGVGASAGGLEAFTELLQGLSDEPGMAFLLVSHLDPHHKSHLPEILAKATRMPVREVKEGMVVQPNNVYVIPPATNMAITDGHLTLTPRAASPAPHMPIDHLFRSLATIQKNRAIAVILSGNGTDGTLALQAIKAEGGMTFVQDEKSAKHPSMPRAAILDGNVDYVLRPSDIAAHLERVARHPYAQASHPPAEPAQPAEALDEAPPESDATAQIINLLRSRTAVDFSSYKQSTIRRRIQRRMALRNLQSPDEYLRVLRDDAGEMHSLYQDFLIRVTQFFRDPEAFEALKEKVFPQMLRHHTPASPIRVWVAGCSTGEEAYSLAIALLEFLDGRPEDLPIKILATDLNEAALDRARAGVYLDNIEIDVSPERLRRFFVRQEGSYQISKSVRELCVFSRHNLANDPPFSRLDLISCRNVLIYMDVGLQKRLLPILHYALNTDGFLFLGSSENIGTFVDLFSVVDAKHRIYGKRPAVLGGPLNFGPGPGVEGRLLPGRRDDGPAVWSALDVQKEADRILLARYAPSGVVVDESMTVLQFRGRTSAFLEPAPGLASLDLFRMLREGLLAEVRGAVAEAKSENKTVSRAGLRLMTDGQPRPVRLEVIPFKAPPSGVRFFLVLFQDMPQPEPLLPVEAPPPPTPGAGEQQVVQLQQEVGALREYLQSVIEEQESTNEELKSANEEILSANEELQSTNEELQTAKEEAQSANEELTTVNEELRHRNVELARVNDDLVNLLSGVSIPIVMVGRDLRIRRFTPLAEKAFNLIVTDIGRPISDIKPNLDLADLPSLIVGVIDTLTPHESEVQDHEGRWHLLRIRAYITQDKKIDGASVVLLDIDAIKREIERLGTEQAST